MSGSEALTGARGQIVWIAALVVSTATILLLERLDLGEPARTPPVSQADPAQSDRATSLLAAAEARLTAAPADAEAAAAVLLALSVAVQTGAIDTAAAQARMGAVLDRAAKAGPDWQPLMLWATMAFPDLPPAAR